MLKQRGKYSVTISRTDVADLPAMSIPGLLNHFHLEHGQLQTLSIHPQAHLVGDCAVGLHLLMLPTSPLHVALLALPFLKVLHLTFRSVVGGHQKLPRLSLSKLKKRMRPKNFILDQSAHDSLPQQSRLQSLTLERRTRRLKNLRNRSWLYRAV